MMNPTTWKIMDYKTIVTIHRKGKSIHFFLKEGEVLSFDNIVDVYIHDYPDSSKREDDLSNSICHLKCGNCGKYYHVFEDKNHLDRCGTPNTVEIS